MQLKLITMLKPSTAHKLSGNWSLVLILALQLKYVLTEFPKMFSLYRNVTHEL